MSQHLLSIILVNLSYFIVLCALLVRDILWLRCILMFGQVLMISYGVFIQNPAISIWNSVFFCVNAVRVTRIIMDRRPVVLPEEMEELRKGLFLNLDPREFLSFWSTGKEFRQRKDDNLVERGKVQDELVVVLKGGFSVHIKDAEIVKIGPGEFVALTSFITGRPATAGVRALTDSTVMAWNRKKIDDLQKLYPQLMIKVNDAVTRHATRDFHHFG